MSTDKTADMLTQIRNGYMASKKEVSMPHSKMREQIASVMKEESYLEKVDVKESGGKKTLILKLKYADDKPSINSIKRISKPGLRIYKGASDLHPVLSGMGCAILSTPKGIMTAKSAKKENVGGELLLELW